MNIDHLNIFEFNNYVLTIRYGYLNKKKGFQHGIYSIPNGDYLLQKPLDLLKSNIGLCYDIIELYRDYLSKHHYINESYYMEYCHGNVIESHAFIIFRKENNRWYECIDNSWENKIVSRGYLEKEQLIRSIYEWFQGYINSQYPNAQNTDFYLNKYSYPAPVYNNLMSLRDYCIQRPYQSSSRIEYSGMAIVFCLGKVLILETKHNEFVFPKGHIEEGETSKDASIRECFEESGVNLANAQYYGECGQYTYTFSAGHLKITNDEFHRIFEVTQITKTIYVHVYEINSFQRFKLERIFQRGYWTALKDVLVTLTHDNTKELFSKALVIYNNRNTNVTEN